MFYSISPSKKKNKVNIVTHILEMKKWRLAYLGYYILESVA